MTVLVQSPLSKTRTLMEGGEVADHATQHASAGSDPLTITTLAGFPGGGTTFLRDDGTFAAGGSYTDEQAQDAIGAMVDTTIVYTDGTPLLSRAALTGAVTASGGSNTTALGSFTKSQLDTAVSDGNVLYVGDVTQYTDELAQDAVGGMLVDTATIDLAYADATPSITANVIPAGLEPLLTLSNQIGPVSIAKGGTGQVAKTAAFDALSPNAVRGDMIIFDATKNTKLAIGAAARLLRSDGTDPSWAQAVLTTDVSGVLPVANGGYQAGSATAASWPKLASGTILTNAEAGAHEFDGTAHYETIDTTGGRAQVCSQHIFRLAANGSAIGNTIADYFGANSAFGTVTNGVYEICAYLWFLKSTAGTVTITITNSQTYTNIAAMRFQCNAAGIGNGAAGAAGIVTTTAAAAALPASGSLTDAVNHLIIIHATAECATAGNIRIQATESAGTITPLRGSWYTARRLFAGNVGTFVA